MASKFYKTAAGEVYGKCGLKFGPEPVEVSERVLGTKRPAMGADENQTIGERLAMDPRLVEVAAPAQSEPMKGERAK